MEQPNLISTFITFGGLLSSIATAVATIFLWLVTRNLARETKRMVEASAHPHVVATIEPNRWSMMHADLRVDNTGNATAYDIHIEFDPPVNSNGTMPLRQISVLKPSQGNFAYLTEYRNLLNKSFSVTVTWRKDPTVSLRETNKYIINLSDVEGMSRLGESEPLVQIADQVKKLREDWRQIASGSAGIKVNTYSSHDLYSF